MLLAGDRVAMYSPNNTEWITTMYATASIGAILVPLNPSYKSLELAHALLHSKAKIIITATKSKGVDMLQTVHAALQQVVTSGSEPVLEHLVTLQQAASGEQHRL